MLAKDSDVTLMKERNVIAKVTLQSVHVQEEYDLDKHVCPPPRTSEQDGEFPSWVSGRTSDKCLEKELCSVISSWTMFLVLSVLWFFPKLMESPE